jgi:hypothetical protein
MKSSPLWLGLFVVSAVTLVGFAQSTKMFTVHLGDQVVTRRAQVIGGVVYAPVDDLLKPFDYRSRRQGDRIGLIPISGVTQRDGVSGTVGVLLKGRTCSVKLGGVRPLAGYEDEWIEVYGQLISPASRTFSLNAAVAVFANGKQVNSTLSAAEMGGEVYAPLQPGETVEFKIQFKKEADSELERVVLTFENNSNDLKDVFRIRVKN